MQKSGIYHVQCGDYNALRRPYWKKLWGSLSRTLWRCAEKFYWKICLRQTRSENRSKPREYECYHLPYLSERQIDEEVGGNWNSHTQKLYIDNVIPLNRTSPNIFLDSFERYFTTSLYRCDETSMSVFSFTCEHYLFT